MSRDEDLDKLEQELASDPYIHEADSKDVQDGALCFMDCTRVCNASCMAFNTVDVDESGNLLEVHDRCLLIYNINAQGAAAMMSIAVSAKRISEVQEELIETQRQNREDAIRAKRSGVTPPDPYGKEKP